MVAAVVEEVVVVAEEAEVSPAQVALRWLLQCPGVTAPIIGVRTMAHLEDNLAAVTWKLSDVQMEKLTKAGEMARPYPYDDSNARMGRDRV